MLGSTDSEQKNQKSILRLSKHEGYKEYSRVAKLKRESRH